MGGMDDMLAACLALGRDCHFEEAHSRQDARLAVRLFDLTADLHHLADECRDLLFWAGLLHDIGYVDGYATHHKTACRLIRQAALPGLSDRERHIVACVARYHRGARPCLDHAAYAALSPDDRPIVALLGALLRLADGLDRTHAGLVRDVDAYLEGDCLVLVVDCAGDCATELWAAAKKGRWLAELLGLSLEVRAKSPRPEI